MGKTNWKHRHSAIGCMMLCILAMCTACGSSNKTVSNAGSSNLEQKIAQEVKAVKPPQYWPTAGWKTSTPEEQGMDSKKLGEVLYRATESNIHSVLLIRNGYIVTEAYNADVQADTPQDILSATKSITSILTGIAVQDKKLKGVDEPLSGFFPDKAAKGTDKAGITVANLLSMTSGLKWDNEGERSSSEMVESDNWINYVLGQPVTGKIGKDFNYSNGNAHVMSAILQKATGMSLSKYAEAKLFNPLGIKGVEWYQDPQNIDIGAFSVHMTARDMAKLGYLYLHQGKWDQTRIVSPEWVEASLKNYSGGEFEDGSSGGYGYFWWLKQVDLGRDKLVVNMFYAAGSGGQRIYVIPALDLVAVFTASTSNSFVVEKYLNEFIEAIRSANPLEPNPEGQASLSAAVQNFKRLQDRVE